MADRQMSKLSPSRFDPTPAVKAAHAAIGAPSAPSWSGYWNWVSAVVILAFVLYTAQKGTLSTWLSFFWWNPQAAPTTTSAASSTGSAVAGAFGGQTATGVVGQILNPSTDPVAGPLSKALGGLGFSLPGSAMGLGN